MAAVNPYRKGLVAWWDLSANANDSHSLHNLSASGTISFSSSKAQLESANTEYYYKTSYSALSTGGGAFSICGFITPTEISAGQRYIVSNGSANTGTERVEWAIRRNGDRIEFGHTTAGTAAGLTFLQSSVSMSAGVEYFFCATWSPATSTKTLIVNTTAVTAGSVASIYNGSQEFYLGFIHNFTSNSFNGGLRCVSLWYTALSADNAEWLYNSGTPRAYSATQNPTPTQELENSATAVDASGGGAPSTITLSLRISGDNRIAIFLPRNRDNNTGYYISSATWNGNAMSNVAGASLINEYAGTQWMNVLTYYYLAPATGKYDIVGTFSTAATLGVAVDAVCWSGIHQSTPIGASNEVNGGTPGDATPTIALTTTVVNSVVLMATGKRYASGGSFTPGTSVTEISDFNSGNASSGDVLAFTGYKQATTTGSYTVDATNTGNTSQWTAVAIELIRAAAPSASNLPRLVGGGLLLDPLLYGLVG